MEHSGTDREHSVPKQLPISIAPFGLLLLLYHEQLLHLHDLLPCALWQRVDLLLRHAHHLCKDSCDKHTEHGKLARALVLI
jgi:hypothetical protein